MSEVIEYTADVSWAGMVDVDPDVVVASAADIPTKPPRQWFDDPALEHLSPLTIKSDGRVFGHIASWSGSHIGRLGKVKPPRSKSGYKYFRHGVVETDDGSEVPVGQITLVGGHAPTDPGTTVNAAIAHYDNTQSAMMDVTIGEDSHGIWVAGALRPGINDIQIRAVKASGVSGDWRPIDNKLELVAICCVNTPGFPIPRALAASADEEDGTRAIYALVAAGVEPLIALAHQNPTVKALEYALVDIETKMDWMRASLAVLASVGYPDDDDEDEDDEPDDDYVGSDDPEDTSAATPPEASPPPAETVDAVSLEPEAAAEDSSDEQQLTFAFDDSLDGEHLAQEILAASGSDLLWSDGLPIHFTQAQCEAVALRLKFRRSVDIDTSKRREALTAGAAMPDGRLPIFTDEDVHQALLVVPEHTEHYAHISRRASALGLDLEEIQQITLVAAAGEKYDFKQRLIMAKRHEALPDGSFPIADEEDLHNAIQSYGRAKDKAKAKAHIMKRARALRKVDLLPEKWED